MTLEELRSVVAATWDHGAPERIADLCNELWTQVRTAHPTLDLAPADFVAALAVHAPRELAELETFLGRCRAGEFALAVSAAAGSIGAIAAIEAACRGTIDAACRRFEGRGHGSEDLRQILRTKLFVAETDRPPAVALYNGQGSLEGWVRVLATRLFIDLGRRRDRARERSEDPNDLAAEMISPSDVALDLVKVEYRGAVAAALEEATRALEPGDRHLLRQHIIGGLSIDQIGAVLGIHRATAARRIARARDKLVDRTRELVALKLQLDERELADLFDLVVSKLDLSLQRLLASRPT